MSTQFICTHVNKCQMSCYEAIKHKHDVISVHVFVSPAGTGLLCIEASEDLFCIPVIKHLWPPTPTAQPFNWTQPTTSAQL